MATGKDTISLYAAGDVVVDRDEPDSIFALSAAVTNEADIAFCQLETVYSERHGAAALAANVPLCAHPRNISALKLAGFDVISLAGNHCLDFGWHALEDTLDLLAHQDIQTVGAGRNIEQARKPAIIERNGIRMSVLAYNSILPYRYWAEFDKPGCAPIRVATVYEPVEPSQPGMPAKVSTFAHRDDLEAMKNDVAKARKSADVVVLSLHWGLHFVPAAVAAYQKEVAYAAIDAGVDLILGHHPHILKPIEVYKGKVIAYSLCNFAFDVNMTREEFEHPRRKEIRRYYQHIEFHEDYPTYPFPVDSRKSMLLKCELSKKGVGRVSFLPVFINGGGQPEILSCADLRSLEVFNYLNEMSKPFGTKLSFEGDEVLIHTA